MSPLDNLTAHQRKVIDLCVRHYCTKEIATMMGVEQSTVVTHKDNACKRAGLPMRKLLQAVHSEYMGRTVNE